MTAQIVSLPIPGTALADPDIRDGIGVLRRAAVTQKTRAGVNMLESIAAKLTPEEFYWLLDRLPTPNHKTK